MRKYKLLIFDVDHTLIDYTQDERIAFTKLFSSHGVSYTDEMLSECKLISQKTWDDFGMNDVSNPKMQEVWHTAYRSHVTTLFKRIFEKYDIKGYDEKAFGQEFISLLETDGSVMDGVEETLKRAKEKGYLIAFATNGITSMQSLRVRPLNAFFDKLYVSEEVGAIKPMRAYFERIKRDFAVDGKDCLMIGDSLSSDILGGIDAGMDTCFLDRKGTETHLGITYKIHALTQLKELI